MNRCIEVVIASDNPDKIKEFREILPDAGRICLRSMREVGLEMKINEDGRSFEENALLKARAVHLKTGGYVLADDSGLAIDVLGGKPGIYSARFAGAKASYAQKIAKLHQMLRPWPTERWDASFICVIALIRPDGSETLARGECRGRIAEASRGDGGFGYDPVFLLPDRNQTMAELTLQEKHQISHRGRALRQVAAWLEAEIAASSHT